jgi:hypothetical protein
MHAKKSLTLHPSYAPVPCAGPKLCPSLCDLLGGREPPPCPSVSHPRLSAGKDRQLEAQLLSFSKEIGLLVGRTVAFTSILLGFPAVTRYPTTPADPFLPQSLIFQAWQKPGSWDHGTSPLPLDRQHHSHSVDFIFGQPGRGPGPNSCCSHVCPGAVAKGS